MRPVLIALITLCALHARQDLSVTPIPEDLRAKMLKSTWHTGCPVAIEDLRVVHIRYLSFQGDQHSGDLIVHRDVASETAAIFRNLLQRGFRIEQVRPVEEFGGDDDASMAANNTSAFNCRDVTGQPGRFSNHSWGRAIDINPLTNPYVKGSTVLPPAGRAHLDRTRDEPGAILANGFVVRRFRSAGWQWGGLWTDRQDYQHFEKPARGGK